MGIDGTSAGLTLINVDELDELRDVLITSPTNNQTLGYDGINHRWVNTSAAGGAGSVTNVSAGVGLSATPNPITGSGEIFLTSTGVSAGSYTLPTITVDAQGRLTAVANGAAGAGTVTSVSVSGKNGINIAGSPITSAGTIDIGLGAITPTGVTTGVVSASILNVTGDIQAATGRITASAATINGLLNGVAASFSGIVSANAGLCATTVSASGVIGGSNLSGTNTGDQTITLTGDVSGAGTSAITAAFNLDSSHGWKAQQYFQIATLTDASAVAWDASTQQVAQLTIAGVGRVLQNPTNMQSGSTYILHVISATASASLTYGNSYRWPSSAAPVITPASGGVSILTFACRASAMYGVGQLDFR